MNALRSINSSEWINAFGWTLLHSLWQAAAVCLMVVIALRLIPTLRSHTRYVIASAGLLLSAAITMATFVHLAANSTDTNAKAAAAIAHHAVYYPEEVTAQPSLFPSIVSSLEQNMFIIVSFWAIGFLIFSLRWASALYQSHVIRASAHPVAGEWYDYIQRTAKGLGIRRPVMIAESLAIHAPIVLGYLKPLILIPTGMIGGLSTQQLETIFLHELAHIRRNDYLMNFFQTIVESVFFFNPFVRMLSNEVRREREYCCDDIVVSLHENRSAYAHALVRLAEARLAAPAFALPLAGDKNQLFSRIKRIMERSAGKSPLKNRLFIPLLIFAGALASISWISSQQEKEKFDAALVQPDTMRDKVAKSARFSQRSFITIDEHGRPHAEVIHEFEGDEELRTLFENDIQLFDNSVYGGGFRPLTPKHFRGGMMLLWSDTIPPFDQRTWQELADAFDERLHERFENLFHSGADPRRLMEEFERSFRWDKWTAPFESAPLDSLRKLPRNDVFKNFREEFDKLRELDLGSFEEIKRAQVIRRSDRPV